MEGWMNGWKYGWMDEWMDGWMDGWVSISGGWVEHNAEELNPQGCKPQDRD